MCIQHTCGYNNSTTNRNLVRSKQKASLTIHACPFVFGNVVLQHTHTLGIGFTWFFPHAFIKKTNFSSESSLLKGNQKSCFVRSF